MIRVIALLISVVVVFAGPREDIIYVAGTQVGAQEKTGHNDGEVDKYLKSVGLGGTGSPYCAAFVYWCAREAGFGEFYPKSAWSPDMVREPTWKQGAGKEPKPADTWGIYFKSKGRVAHTGFVKKWNAGSGIVTTIEANTSPEATSGSSKDRDGDGVWSKIRPIRTIYSAKSWLP